MVGVASHAVHIAINSSAAELIQRLRVAGRSDPVADYAACRRSLCVVSVSHGAGVARVVSAYAVYVLAIRHAGHLGYCWRDWILLRRAPCTYAVACYGREVCCVGGAELVVYVPTCAVQVALRGNA